MVLMGDIAKEKGIRLLECQAIVDHAHLLLEISSETELPKMMNLLKGASARRLFLQFPDLRMDEGITNFWQAGYSKKFVPPAAINRVRHYIRTQWDRLEDYDK